MGQPVLQDSSLRKEVLIREWGPDDQRLLVIANGHLKLANRPPLDTEGAFIAEEDMVVFRQTISALQADVDAKEREWFRVGMKLAEPALERIKQYRDRTDWESAYGDHGSFSILRPMEARRRVDPYEMSASQVDPRPDGTMRRFEIRVLPGSDPEFQRVSNDLDIARTILTNTCDQLIRSLVKKSVSGMHDKR